MPTMKPTKPSAGESLVTIILFLVCAIAIAPLKVILLRYVAKTFFAYNMTVAQALGLSLLRVFFMKGVKTADDDEAAWQPSIRFVGRYVARSLIRTAAFAIIIAASVVCLHIWSGFFH